MTEIAGKSLSTSMSKRFNEFCRSRGLQDADARDVTQEVLVQISRRVEAWDSSKGKFRSWLFRITQNIATDKFHEWVKHAGSGDSRVATLMSNRPCPTDEGVEWEYRRAALRWAARLFCFSWIWNLE